MEIIINNYLLLSIIWLIPVVVIHELGHYVGYRLFGVKPKIEFKWWGVSIGEQKDLFKLKPEQYGFVSLSGVFAGMVYTMPFGTNFLLLYFIISGIDLYQMFYVFSAMKDKWKKNMGEWVIQLYEKELKELKTLRN